MADQPVTPQRVRNILSSFVYESEKRTSPTSPGKSPASPETGKKTGQQGAQTGSPSCDGISPEVASNRRTFASFLKRVETFSPMTWFAKPPELCPLVCSRYGWENTEYDMLHCTACKANLCGALPAKSNAGRYKTACEGLKKRLQTGHQKFCTLAVHPCPETFLKVGLHDVDELRKSFMERVCALRVCAQHLPDLVYTQMETWGFAESHAAKFCAQEDMTERDTPTQVITLAFTGWTRLEKNRHILVCSLCRRQIGLWNFTPTRGRPVTNGSRTDLEEGSEDSGDSGPPCKMRKIEPQAQLDPINSHHAWCPWIGLRESSEDAMTLLPIPENTSSSSAPSTFPPSTPSKQSLTQDEGSPGQGGGDAGRMLRQKHPTWVLVVRLVAPGLLSQSRCLVEQVKQSSIVEGLHCIRKVLTGWSSPENKKTSADLSTSVSTSPS